MDTKERIIQVELRWI